VLIACSCSIPDQGIEPVVRKERYGGHVCRWRKGRVHRYKVHVDGVARVRHRNSQAARAKAVEFGREAWRPPPLLVNIMLGLSELVRAGLGRVGTYS